MADTEDVDEVGENTNEALDENSGLAGRLAYLSMLMRRQERGPGGGPRAGGFRGQGRVLHLLSVQSPTAQKELAYLLGIRSQSLAELLSKLGDAGLVERHPDPQDRRTSLVELTEKGRALAEQRKELARRDPFAVLDEGEQQLMGRMLDRVIEQMETDLPEGPDPRMEAFKRAAFGAGAEPGGVDGPAPFGRRGPGRPGGRGHGRGGRRRRGGPERF